METGVADPDSPAFRFNQSRRRRRYLDGDRPVGSGRHRRGDFLGIRRWSRHLATAGASLLLVCVCLQICARGCVCMCAYKCMSIAICTCTYISLCLYMHTCVCVWVLWMYTFLYLYIYKHTIVCCRACEDVAIASLHSWKYCALLLIRKSPIRVNACTTLMI